MARFICITRPGIMRDARCEARGLNRSVVQRCCSWVQDSVNQLTERLAMTDVPGDDSGNLNGRLLRHDCAEDTDAANHPVLELFSSYYITGAWIRCMGQ